MAWLVGDSFDFYQNSNDLLVNSAVWQPGAGSAMNFSVITTGGRFGIGAWCHIGNTSATIANLYTIQFANSSPIWVNMNLISSQAHVNGGTQQTVGFTLRDGLGAIQCGVWLRNGGDFVVTSGNVNSTVLATSPVLAPNHNVWMHIQAKIDIHHLNGAIELRHTNAAGTASTPWIATGLNTRNGTANPYANIVHLTCTAVSGEGVDDFYVFNDQGAQPNTWQGDVFAVQNMPNADIAVDWTRNSGTNNSQNVDDPRHDADTTYVKTANANDEDTYNINPLFTTPAAIIAVALKYVARMDDAGPHAVDASLISGPTTDTLPFLVCTNAYTYQQKVYPADPNTGAPWSAENLNNAQLKIRCVL